MDKADRFVPPGAQARNGPPPLSLNQAAAALVALLNGAEQMPSDRATAVRRAPRLPRPDHFSQGRSPPWLSASTAAEAATAIVGLINSRPVSPLAPRNRGHHRPRRFGAGIDLPA